jgi:ketosteroid isomerase-like protein
MVNAEEVFRSFVAAVNSNEVEALAALMTPDHLFVDSLGNRTMGADTMKAGWGGYFAMCPDYWIRADDVVADGGLVLAVGEAGGTIDGVAWRTPAAWKAMIREGKVAEWRVFTENTPVFEILAKRQR